jgi:hypothetical protein
LHSAIARKVGEIEGRDKGKGREMKRRKARLFKSRKEA